MSCCSVPGVTSSARAVLGCPQGVWAAVRNAAVSSVCGREPKQGSAVLWVPGQCGEGGGCSLRLVAPCCVCRAALAAKPVRGAIPCPQELLHFINRLLMAPRRAMAFQSSLNSLSGEDEMLVRFPVLSCFPLCLLPASHLHKFHLGHHVSVGSGLWVQRLAKCWHPSCW